MNINTAEALSFKRNKRPNVTSGTLFPKGISTLSKTTGLDKILSQAIAGNNVSSLYTGMQKPAKNTLTGFRANDALFKSGFSCINQVKTSATPTKEPLLTSNKNKLMTLATKNDKLSQIKAQDKVLTPVIKMNGESFPMIYTIKGESSLALYTDMTKVPDGLSVGDSTIEFKGTTFDKALLETPREHAVIVNPECDNLWFSAESVKRLQEIKNS